MKPYACKLTFHSFNRCSGSACELCSSSRPFHKHNSLPWMMSARSYQMSSRFGFMAVKKQPQKFESSSRVTRKHLSEYTVKRNLEIQTTFIYPVRATMEALKTWQSWSDLSSWSARLVIVWKWEYFSTDVLHVTLNSIISSTLLAAVTAAVSAHPKKGFTESICNSNFALQAEAFKGGRKGISTMRLISGTVILAAFRE